MCINFDPVPREVLDEHFKVAPPPEEWPPSVWMDYAAPIIVSREGKRAAIVATYGLIPKDKWPPNVRLSTMNARAETVGEKRAYSQPWKKSQLCLVPMTGFYEPNYESGKSERWRISLTDDKPFAVAGLWQVWDTDTEAPRHTFTQLTINSDGHPFMSRFHKPGDEKRSLVILTPEDYDAWLTCGNPEIARSFLQLYPAELLTGQPKPNPPRLPKAGRQ